MGARKCCVDNCNTQDTSILNGLKKTKSIFKFPQDLKEKAKWLRIIPGKLKNENFICIEHFEENQYVSVEQFTNKPIKPRLIFNAIPTIFNGFPKHLQKKLVQPRSLNKNVTKNETSIDNTAITTEQKEKYKNLKHNNSNYEPNSNTSSFNEDHIQDFNSLKQHIFKKIHLNSFDVKICEHEIILYKMNLESEIPTIETSIRVNSNLQARVQHHNIIQSNVDLDGIVDKFYKINSYSQITSIITLYSKVNDVKNIDSYLETATYVINQALDIAKSSDNYKFTSNLEFICGQLKLIRSTRKKYSPSDLLFAMTIFMYSSACYGFIRDNGFIILPHQQTIHKLKSCQDIGANSDASDLADIDV